MKHSLTDFHELQSQQYQHSIIITTLMVLNGAIRVKMNANRIESVNMNVPYIMIV